MIFGVLAVNKYFGSDTITDKGNITASDSDPLIYYKSYNYFGSYFVENPSMLYNVEGEKIGKDTRIESIQTGGSVVFVEYNKTDVIERMLEKQNGILNTIEISDEMKETFINTLQKSPSGKYLLFIGSSDAGNNTFITNIWIYNYEEKIWSENVSIKLPFSKEVFSQLLNEYGTSIGWEDSKDILQIKGENHINLDDNGIAEVLFEYKYNPMTNIVTEIKPKDEDFVIDIKTEEISDDSTVIKERGSSYSIERLGSYLGSIVFLPLNTISKIAFGSPVYYIPEKCDGYCASYIVNKNEIISDRYLKVTNPVIGKQTITLIDENDNSEKELFSWTSTWNNNYINALFAEGTDWVMIIINEKVGVYNLKTDAFKWILEVDYNPNGFDGDQITPYDLVWY